MEPLTRDDPRQIAGYGLHARLGAGGMGLVYLGFTPGGRAVAVKVMRPELGDDRAFRDRFRQEIEAARRVHGLYTAQVIDADPAAVPPWMVTAYVPGPSLQQAVADHGPMPAQTVYRLMAGVAEALQAIHAVGVVHRDLEPSNVLLAPDGPRVIDFGIARAAEATALTRTGMLVGSPQFMAPEQIAGQPTTPATDIFALGSLAAYAVLGRSPFGDGGGEAVLYRILHQDPDLTGCPMPLRTMIERCLAKDTAHRPWPTEIISFCRAQQSDHATAIAQSWLPPGVAADPAYRSTLGPGLPGQAAPPGGPAPIPTAVAPPVTAGPPPFGPGTGLWLWMAHANRNGRSWARNLSTVLFALLTLGLLVSLHSNPVMAARATALIQWALALAALVLLWVTPSNAYFAAMRRPAYPHPPPHPPPYPPWAGHGPPQQQRTARARQDPSAFGPLRQPGKW
jgi:serine/threonine kinase PknH